MEKIKLRNKRKITAIAHSPRNGLFAVAQAGDEVGSPCVHLFAADGIKNVSVFETEPYTHVSDLAFSVDGTKLYCLIDRQILRIYHTAAGKKDGDIALDAPAVSLQIHPQEPYALLEGAELQLWNLIDGQKVWSHIAYNGEGRSEGISRDRLAGYYTLPESLPRSAYLHQPARAVFMENGAQVWATGINDAFFHVYDTRTGTQTVELPGGVFQANGLHTDPAGRYLLLRSAIPDCNLLFGLPGLQRMLSQYLNEAHYAYSAVAFHPQAPCFVCGAHGGSVDLRSLHTGEYLQEFGNHKAAVSALCFLNGETLLSGDIRGNLYLHRVIKRG